ncbi:response regulator transcription factor [Caldalkalibacillus uzonensis]|uniref:response regulator transcription factor n=1 Tax=Caldalkalibacillus uzonensis TaxID=353224 RepID=UPI003522B946
MTNEEIAQHLYISQHTVKTHIQRIYKKLGVQNRTELIVAYFKGREHEQSGNNECSNR